MNPTRTEIVFIDGHTVEVGTTNNGLTVVGVCQCGVSAVSHTLANVEKMIHAKHKPIMKMITDCVNAIPLEKED